MSKYNRPDTRRVAASGKLIGSHAPRPKNAELSFNAKKYAYARRTYRELIAALLEGESFVRGKDWRKYDEQLAYYAVEEAADAWQEYPAEQAKQAQLKQAPVEQAPVMSDAECDAYEQAYARYSGKRPGMYGKGACIA